MAAKSVVADKIFAYAEIPVSSPKAFPVAKTPAPDYGRDLGKLEGAVDVLSKLAIAILSILVAIIVGGIGLFVQISDLKSVVTQAQNDIKSAAEKLRIVESAIGDLRAGQVASNNILTRIDSNVAALRSQNTPPQLPLNISADDAQFIRASIKFDPAAAYQIVGKIGQRLTDAKLLEFPEAVLKRLPDLQSYRYVFDLKGQLLIASAADQRVVAIV